MNFQEYLTEVKKTEASPDPDNTIHVGFVCSVLEAIWAHCEVLDLCKKSIFYGQDISKERMQTAVDRAAGSSTFMDDTYDNINSVSHIGPLLEAMDFRLMHGLIGSIGEAGELATTAASILSEEILQAHRINIKEELGDMAWYNALITESLGETQESIWEANIRKLRKRYGEKFSLEAAVTRDTKAELDALTFDPGI